MKTEFQVVACDRCKARVQAKVLHCAVSPPEEDIPVDEEFFLLQCQECRGVTLTCGFQGDRGERTRLFPPRRTAHYGLPSNVRDSLNHTFACLDAGHYMSTALLCRRTLETTCREFYPDLKNFYDGLERLHKDKKIDDRLYRWANSLRQDGNFAAHDPSFSVTASDAQDLAHFTEAILDYIFVLERRYEQYIKRRDLVKSKGANSRRQGKD